MRVLVTGAAGFIGAAVAERLLQRGDRVLGIDSLNDYYDPRLKEARLQRLHRHEAFAFQKMDLAEGDGLRRLLRQQPPQRVVHLAAQAGVRYSIDQPSAYVDANIVGFLGVLEAVREVGVEHLVFASSSSVYGANARLPYAAEDHAEHPVSLYAASKKANELMAHVYSHLFGIAATGLRFFSVYGPWGRPDMALFLFTRRILAGEAIDVHNHGQHARDFTYIDDIAEGVLRVLDRPAAPDPAWDARRPNPAASCAPFRVYNIGRGESVPLLRFIELIEDNLGRRARRNCLPMQDGDVAETLADISPLERDFGYRPSTSVETGVARFVAWYRDYYGVAAAP